MRIDRETKAWAVVWACFAVFCVSCVAVLLGGRWYLQSATEPRQATLKIVVGTVAVREVGKQEWLLASQEMTLKEGYAIRTERASQALVSFFDESTVTLLPETELTFSQMRSSQFSFAAPLRNHLKLVQKSGKTVVGVAQSEQGSTRFEVDTPEGSVSLSEGSYAVDVNSRRTRVRVKEGGRAVVTAQSKTEEALRGQRIDAYLGEPPRSPEPAAIELIANGDFASGLEGWKTDNIPGFPEGTDILGAVQVVQGGGTPAIRFVRMQSKGTHNETYIAQELDEDVSDLTKLQLSLEFKLVMQNVSGGGYVGSEYPLLVRVHYRSDQGEAYVIRGFYYQNEANNRTDNGMAVVHNTWIPWTSENLLMNIVPVPRKITRIELGASGHDYISEVRKISLTGE